MKLTARVAALTLIAFFTAAGALAQEDDGAAPQPTPNRIKYQDSKPNAKGTGQLATVETRALLARDGTAALEVTTGNLDTGEPSATANITKVQLDVNGTTTNFNHLDEGGTFVIPLTGVQRYTPFHAHVNVMGLNGGNTEVVQVDDVVRRRPDLQIESVDAPGAVRVNQPFSIIATIRELNGDTGARTTCRLENQNGQVLDEAQRIWVDAGDTVQCIFSQTLGTLGKTVYFVKLGAVEPAAWNPSTQFQGFIVQATTNKQWELTATQRVIHQTYTETASTDPDHPTSGESTETTDNMHFNAVIADPMDLDTLTMSIEERTDGNLIYAYPEVGGMFPGSPCRLSDRRSSIYQICRFEGGLALDAITVGANALYVSRFWTAQFDPASGENVYTLRSMKVTSKFGPLLRYGSTYQLRITLHDEANHYWEVSPFVNLIPYENPVETTTTYRETPGITYRVDSTYQETGKRGSASQE